MAHTKISVKLEKQTPAVNPGPMNNASGDWLWVARCSCGSATAGRCTKAAAENLQREHRNDAKILAGLGVAS